MGLSFSPASGILLVESSGIKCSPEEAEQLTNQLFKLANVASSASKTEVEQSAVLRRL